LSQPLWWYTIRASGLVAWALLLGAVAWGLVLSIRPIRRPRPAWALDLHRFLGGLAFVFIALHLVGLLFDSFVGFSLTDLLVPMASHWRPGAVAFGVVAVYLAVAVEVTSLFMRRLPRRVWHSVHLLSLVALVLVTVHAFTAGADASSPVVVALGVLSSAVVASLGVVRVLCLVLDRRRATVRPALPGAVAPAPAAIPVGVPVGVPVAVTPPPPRDPRRRYDPTRDPLFLPRTPVIEVDPDGAAPPLVPEPERASLLSG
jgi:methionine sulfoxide reductase heme-binding subunit